jgi:hypothetical protein
MRFTMLNNVSAEFDPDGATIELQAGHVYESWDERTDAIAKELAENGDAVHHAAEGEELITAKPKVENKAEKPKEIKPAPKPTEKSE